MEGGAFDSLGWIEIVFVGLVALGFGFWQLWSVNREIAQDRKNGEDGADRKIEKP